MRRILRKITVQTASGGAPRAFVWRGRNYTVQHIIEHWKESGCWWDHEPEREVYRVLDSAGKTFEMHCFYEPLFSANSKQEDRSLLTLLEGSSARKEPVHWILYAVED